jgi:hypothetical protein
MSVAIAIESVIAAVLRFVLLPVLLAICLGAGSAQAHLSSGSYLHLDISGQTIDGQWDIALRDLDVAIGLDADGDGAITWGEVRAKQHDIEAYALSRLRLSGGAADCALHVTQQLVDQHADGGYAVLRFNAACPPRAHVLTLTYRLLFDLDPTHSGLLTVNDNGNISTAVLNAQRMTYTVAPGAAATSGFMSFLRLGIEHILSGRDHLLFLGVLLVPALGGVRRRGIWASLIEVAGLLSLFTAAHAVTVTLAAMSIVEVPARISEAAIAFSIAVTAADNIWRFLGPRRGMIAFGFGLIHGLGFASALGPLALRGWPLIAALAGFNSGIELVQLTLALLAFTLAFALTTPRFTLRNFGMPNLPVPARWRPDALLLPLCSLAILTVSAFWFVDRSFLLVVQP